MPLEIGFLLNNRYRIESTIASGGMGSIYRAVDETFSIAVAVKENFFANEEFSRQFRREATILASLRHPNLPRVTDHFVVSGVGQYLVMDFIEGLDLRELIARQGTLPVGDAVRIGVITCDALGYLHSRTPPIVHRDIKPGNLKITPEGHVFLVDFGLAKLSRGEATTIGAQALTPGYAPPEQYGQGTETRSDLYSLGATLYAALTGKVPEDGLSRIMGSSNLTSIRRFNTQVPLQLANVIEQSMMVNLDQRFQTADEFRNALIASSPDVDLELPVLRSLQASHQQPVEVISAPKSERPVPLDQDPRIIKDRQLQAQSAQVAYPVQPSTKRSILPLISILAVLFVMAGIAALFILPRLLNSISKTAQPVSMVVATTEPSETPGMIIVVEPSSTITLTQSVTPTATDRPTQTLQPTETETPEPTILPELISTPAGDGPGQIAYASDQSGTVQIWLADLNGNTTQITKLADGACQPAWSPDGQRMVFISPCSAQKEDYAGSSLYLINADGSGLVPLSSLPGGDYDPAWSPDGSQIAFTTLRDNSVPHIYLYFLADSTVKRLSRIVNYERQPAWSPDGKWLAYQTTRNGQPQVWTMSAQGENAQEFSSLAGSFEWKPVWAPDNSILVYSQGSPSQLVARQVDDKQAKEFPLSDKVRPAEGADFSPDGWWVVFESKQNGNLDIFYMLKNGTNMTRLTDHPGLDIQPAWRPSSQP